MPDIGVFLSTRGVVLKNPRRPEAVLLAGLQVKDARPRMRGETE